MLKCNLWSKDNYALPTCICEYVSILHHGMECKILVNIFAHRHTCI